MLIAPWAVNFLLYVDTLVATSHQNSRIYKTLDLEDCVLQVNSLVVVLPQTSNPCYVVQVNQL